MTSDELPYAETPGIEGTAFFDKCCRLIIFYELQFTRSHYTFEFSIEYFVDLNDLLHGIDLLFPFYWRLLLPKASLILFRIFQVLFYSPCPFLKNMGLGFTT